MGRRRQTPPVEPRADRISAQDLAQWMKVNSISASYLARMLGRELSTVQSWLKGYRHTPPWLEQDINWRAGAVEPKLPFWGQKWPVGKEIEAHSPDHCEHCGSPLALNGACTWGSCPGKQKPAPFTPPAPEPLPDRLASLPEAPDDLWEDDQ